MRSIQIVAAIFALIFFSSCSIDNLEPNHKVVGSSDIITVLGRVSNFTEQDVVTRSPKDNAERRVTSIAMAIFPVKNDGTGVNGDCVYYEYFPNSNEVMFAINRGDNTFNNGRYVIYAFANMPGMNVDGFGEGTSLEAMLSKAYNLSDEPVNIPGDGFPMIGSLGDTFSANTERDNKILYIKPDGDSDPNITPKPGENSDPIIREPIKNEAGNITWDGGRTENTLTIPMKAMYAKINFTLNIDPAEKDETGTNFPPQFTFEGYTINNIPTSVDFDMATNSDTEVINSIAGTGVTGQSILVDNDDELKFSFYLPERLLVPNTDPNFSYPFNSGDYDEIVDKDQNGYRDEDEINRQRYKGLLLGSGQKATNIVISGKYRDHQNLSYDVDYTIHLGEDNYGDFNIIRNKEYNNFVTIKGIENSNDGLSNDGKYTVAFDHRVNIERSQPAIISLRREMLLDSHFEIRPLRVRKSNVGNVGDINAVKVEVLNPTTTNWMRIERSFGDGKPGNDPTTTIVKADGTEESVSIYLDEDKASPSYGKRRFFTYNLIDGVDATLVDATLKNSTEVILPLTENGECCWIYVDECIETGDGVRSGVVQVTYGNLTGNQFTPTKEIDTFPIVKYTINQRKLFTVTNNGHTYRIEYEEEYLYDFDSENAFGETEYEGMPWGLNGVRLSYEHEALFFKSYTSSDIGDLIVNFFKGDTPAYYDFYIKSHDESRLDPRQVALHERAGYDFCNEIIANLKDPERNGKTEMIIDELALNEQPKSAIEYCYNKNKRNSKGKVYDVNWYLPAIDEIEEIVTSKYDDNKTYLRFLDFQGKFYWSSQPAYIQNYAHVSWLWGVFTYWGNFYYDDIGDTKFDETNETDRYKIGSARATRVYVLDNEYMSVPSGTNGYYSFYDADDDDGDPYEYSGTFNRQTIGTISREEGNLARNDMARVRCVRKIN